MTASQAMAPLRLATFWNAGVEGRPQAYELALTNLTQEPIADFTLCVSGPARIDPTGVVEGGTIGRRISNFTELRPPAGFVLAPGGTWRVTIPGMVRPLCHWSDGAGAAYVVLARGHVLTASVSPTERPGHADRRRRGPDALVISDTPAEPYAIVPWPAKVGLAGRRAVPAGLALQPETGLASACNAFVALVARLFPADGLVRPEVEGGFPVVFVQDMALAAEAYRLAFEAEHVVVTASQHAGFLYGLVTLGQIWRGAVQRPDTLAFPASGTVEDAPGMAWRGLHLDAARQFYGTEETEQLLAVMAWNKLNGFHWHLSDDEAWRIEIDAFPSLTSVGAWRGHGLAVPPLLGSGAERTGGYYTKAAVRRIVAWAGRLGIAVVPEVDIPGHCFAMQASLPALRDPDETGLYHSVQGFPNNCLNPALPETYATLRTIFAEMAELFPARIMHVGADEVPLGAWSGSPAALALLHTLAGPEAVEAHRRRLNVVTNTHGADDIEGSGAAVLQAHFLQRVQEILIGQGWRMGGWEEAAHGEGLHQPTSYLCAWRDVEIAAALADRGYQVVVCPGQVYYLDMALSAEWEEPGASWAGHSGLESLYGFDPVLGWTEGQRGRLWGIQACIWSESMTDRAIFDRLVFPRLSAMAETAWTEPDRKSWRRFKDFAGLMPILYGRG